MLKNIANGNIRFTIGPETQKDIIRIYQMGQFKVVSKTKKKSVTLTSLKIRRKRVTLSDTRLP